MGDPEQPRQVQNSVIVTETNSWFCSLMNNQLEQAEPTNPRMLAAREGNTIPNGN